MEPADLLLLQIRAAGLPEPTREFRFSEDRRWRFDFAWPDEKLALEYEGGSFINGAHGRGKQFEMDAVKYGIALLLGWRVLRVNSHMVDDGRALAFLKLALKNGGGTWFGDFHYLVHHRCEKCMTKKEKLKRLAKEASRGDR